MMKLRIPRTGVSSAALSAVLAVTAFQSPAMAQDQREAGAESIADSGESTAASDIVVRATKRPSALLDTPISVTAVTAEDIEKMGVKDLEGLSRHVPSLVVEQSSEQSDKAFVIRGIGTLENSATVAVYLDDTPLTFGPSNPDLKLFDVDQVEVLRGPQGTLFGSSSMGGAIRYSSPEASTNRLTGMVHLEGSTIRHGEPSFEARGVLSGPLAGDKLAIRASGFYRREGGFVDLRDENTGEMVDDNFNHAKSFGGRLAMEGKIGETVDVSLSAIYQQTDQDGISTFFSGRGVSGTPDPFDIVDLPALSRVDRTDVYSKDRVFLPNLTVNVDLGSFATLTSSTSYFLRKRKISSDFSYYFQKALGIPDPSDLMIQNIEDRRFDAFSQEVRLASAADGPLQWIVGAYYRDTDEKMPQYLVHNVGPFDLFTRETVTKRTQKALFGEASYELVDALTLTAGVRFTENEMKVDRQADGLLNGGFSELQIKSKESPITPKFSAKYDINEHAMVYATVAKGFREGGPNAPVPTTIPACQAALDALGLTDAPASYKSDSLWSYEIGAKFRTDDRKFQLVGSAYQINWNDVQQTINLSTGGCGFGFTDNVGKARSRGFEIETIYTPTDYLNIALSIGHTDARLTEDLVTGAVPDGMGGLVPLVAAEEGTRLALVPDWTISLSGQYDFDLSDNWKGFARAEYLYQGDVKRHLNTPTDDPAALNRDAYSIINLRLGVITGDNEFNVFVNNVLDEDSLIYQSYLAFAPGTAYEAVRVKPRVIGLSYRRDF